MKCVLSRGSSPALVLCGFTALSTQGEEPRRHTRTTSRSKHALLVGCTKYEKPGIPELWGPANDVPLWRKTLEQQFGFPASNIEVLLGWPDEPDRRPTRAEHRAGVRGPHRQSRAQGPNRDRPLGHGARRRSPKATTSERIRSPTAWTSCSSRPTSSLGPPTALRTPSRTTTSAGGSTVSVRRGPTSGSSSTAVIRGR